MCGLVVERLPQTDLLFNLSPNLYKHRHTIGMHMMAQVQMRSMCSKANVLYIYGHVFESPEALGILLNDFVVLQSTELIQIQNVMAVPAWLLAWPLRPFVSAEG